jgi:hypothetical protein
MRRPQALVLLVALLTLSQNDARAQPKLPMIGFMGQGTASAEGQRAAAFVQRLRELGWIEGQNGRDRVPLGGGTKRAQC